MLAQDKMWCHDPFVGDELTCPLKGVEVGLSSFHPPRPPRGTRTQRGETQVTEKTKYRIAGGALAFALGMIFAGIANAQVAGAPESGDTVNVHGICDSASAAVELLQTAGIKDLTDEDNARAQAIFEEHCVVFPQPVEAPVNDLVESGPWYAPDDTLLGADVWGIDADGDGKSDVFTIIVYEGQRPSA
jgi:hypothetical protein